MRLLHCIPALIISVGTYYPTSTSADEAKFDFCAAVTASAPSHSLFVEHLTIAEQSASRAVTVALSNMAVIRDQKPQSKPSVTGPWPISVNTAALNRDYLQHWILVKSQLCGCLVARGVQLEDCQRLDDEREAAKQYQPRIGSPMDVNRLLKRGK